LSIRFSLLSFSPFFLSLSRYIQAITHTHTHGHTPGHKETCRGETLTVCHTYGSRRWKVFSFSCWNYFSFFKLFFLLKISFSELDRFCFWRKMLLLICFQ
jgi:hypothetical protein